MSREDRLLRLAERAMHSHQILRSEEVEALLHGAGYVEARHNGGSHRVFHHKSTGDPFVLIEGTEKRDTQYNAAKLYLRSIEQSAEVVPQSVELAADLPDDMEWVATRDFQKHAIRSKAYPFIGMHLNDPTDADEVLGKVVALHQWDGEVQNLMREIGMSGGVECISNLSEGYVTLKSLGSVGEATIKHFTPFSADDQNQQAVAVLQEYQEYLAKISGMYSGMRDQLMEAGAVKNKSGSTEDYDLYVVRLGYGATGGAFETTFKLTKNGELPTRYASECMDNVFKKRFDGLEKRLKAHAGWQVRKGENEITISHPFEDETHTIRTRAAFQRHSALYERMASDELSAKDRVNGWREYDRYMVRCRTEWDNFLEFLQVTSQAMLERQNAVVAIMNDKQKGIRHNFKKVADGSQATVAVAHPLWKKPIKVTYMYFSPRSKDTGPIIIFNKRGAKKLMDAYAELSDCEVLQARDIFSLPIGGRSLNAGTSSMAVTSFSGAGFRPK